MKIIFVALGGIGDFIMFTPLVKEVVAKCEPESIGFVVENSVCAELALRFPKTEHVCIYEGLWKTAKILKREHYDVAEKYMVRLGIFYHVYLLIQTTPDYSPGWYSTESHPWEHYYLVQK